MAGGKGTRLRPLTCDLPKPMMPIMNRPMMEHILNLLKKHDITDICATLQYRPDVIKYHFEDGSRFGMNIKYYIEEIPLGTAGSVKNAQDFLDETFIVISGDVLTDIDLTEAIEFHKNKGALATLVLTKQDIPLEYGVVVTDYEGRIVRFLEKPDWSEVFSDTVNTGIYILEPEVLEYFDKETVFDFSKDLFPLLLKKGKPLFGFISNGYWCDIGNPDTYIKAHWDILENKVKGNFLSQSDEGIHVGRGTKIPLNCKINPPVVIGSNCNIEQGVLLDSYTIIGNNVTVKRNASIKRSIINDNCYIGPSSELRGALICKNTIIKSGSSVFEGAVIGENTILENRVVIRPGVKIWPQKIIDAETVVASNVIWGNRSPKSLFGSSGIKGIVSDEITPEFVIRLGGAYASMLSDNNVKHAKKIGISCEKKPLNDMLKSSLVAGLLSGGAEVIDMGDCPLPVFRWAIKYLNLTGAIKMNLDGDITNIEFFDEKGINIDKDLRRKLQASVQRSDFQFCKATDIKSVKTLKEDLFELYFDNKLQSFEFKSPTIQNKLTICYQAPSKTIEQLCEKFFQKLSIEAYPLAENMNPDITFSINGSGDSFQVITKTGQIIEENTLLALLSLIKMKRNPDSVIVVPYKAPGIFEKLSEIHGGKVYRASSSLPKLLSKQYQMEAYDDCFTNIINLLDYLNMTGSSLESLIKEIPEYFFKEAKIKCPWKFKGQVIRHFMQHQEKDTKIEALEGVKLFHKNGSVLVIPDADEPFCLLSIEGKTENDIENLFRFYNDKIEKMIESNDQLPVK